MVLDLAEIKRIPGYEDYSISKTGIVFSYKYSKIRILKYGNDGNGYLTVNLSRLGTCKTMKVHRLMAMTFLDFNPRLQVNHKNGFKQDNSLDNLEMVTRQQNIAHAHRLGLKVGLKGVLHNKAKFTEAEIINIRDNLINNMNRLQIAKLYGVCWSTIDRIVRREHWKHI